MLLRSSFLTVQMHYTCCWLHTVMWDWESNKNPLIWGKSIYFLWRKVVVYFELGQKTFQTLTYRIRPIKRPGLLENWIQGKRLLGTRHARVLKSKDNRFLQFCMPVKAVADPGFGEGGCPLIWKKVDVQEKTLFLKFRAVDTEILRNITPKKIRNLDTEFCVIIPPQGVLPQKFLKSPIY